MKQIYLYLLCFLLLISFQDLVSQTLADKQQKAWNLAVNKGEDLGKYYWSKATLFLSNEIYTEKEQIQEQLKQLIKTEGKITSIETKSTVLHRHNNFFEIGFYVFEKASYGFLIGWKKVGEDWLKEIEILFHQAKVSTVDISEIDAARKKWVDLSNAHDHGALIREVYTADGIYVNQGKVDKGTDQIIERYAYMSNPDWKIQLYPKEFLQVQAGIFYEIGEYVSNGKGHYVIIWEKQKNGAWQACLDFNF